MGTERHSGHEIPSAVLPDLSIFKTLRTALIALMCVSGGCATVSSTSRNLMNTQPTAQKINKPAATVTKPLPIPVNKANQSEDNPQINNKPYKPFLHNDDEDSEYLKGLPCDRLKLNRPGACEIALIDKFLSNANS